MSGVTAARRRALSVGLVAITVGGLVAASFFRGVDLDSFWVPRLDARSWLGVPHAGDVLSNAPFLVAGLAGLRLVWRQRAPGAAFGSEVERRGWLIFFLFVAATAFSSAWFHLAPSPGRLVFDRVTIAIAVQGLFCALLAERLAPRAAAALLAPLALAAIGATWWWWHTVGNRPDLRWYVAAQFLPIAGMVLLLLATPSRDAGLGLWWLVLLYGAAKACEAYDVQIREALGVLSGHSFKHILAGGAGWQAFVVLRRRVRP